MLLFVDIVVQGSDKKDDGKEPLRHGDLEPSLYPYLTLTRKQSRYITVQRFGNSIFSCPCSCIRCLHEFKIPSVV